VPDKPSSVYWISRPLSEAKKAIREAGTVTVLVTGRIGVHKRRVRELLAQKGLDFDYYYFNPGMGAARFKVVVLKNLLVGHNTIDSVEVWENENMKTYDSALRATAKAVDRNVKVEVHHVHVAPKELECGPEDFNLPSQNTQISDAPEARMASADLDEVKREYDNLRRMSPHYLTSQLLEQGVPQARIDSMGRLDQVLALLAKRYGQRAVNRLKYKRGLKADAPEARKLARLEEKRASAALLRAQWLGLEEGR
jgi:hypothetical protein